MSQHHGSHRGQDHASHHGSHHHGGGGDAPMRTFWTKRRVAIVAAVALLAMGAFVVLTACGQAPPPKGPQPAVAAPTAGGTDRAPAADATQAGGFAVSGPDGDQTRIEVGGLAMPKPVTWVWTKPTMQFRALQYAVPADGVNAPAAELVLSVFPAGDGGPVDANLDRWANQFRDGDAAAPSKRSDSEVNGMKVSRIESTGAYMGMGAAAPRPGHMQLGAIVQAPGRNVFIKLVGPQATVESNRAAFDAMLAGMR